MKLIKCVFALAILSTLTVGAVAQDVDQAASGVVYVTVIGNTQICLLYTSPSPRDQRGSRMPSSA